MRVLAHLSDIHFGAIDPPLVEGVQRYLHEVCPDYTIISGDLTQRARAGQFREARAFLDSLPGRQLVIPGNHDVPLWNVFARFLTPLSNYRRYITADLAPTLGDEEVGIVGINTARSLTQKNGRINAEQVRVACRQLAHYDARAIKLVVTHHPFDLDEQHSRRDLVGGAKAALRRLAAAGADILLAGHHHKAYTGGTAKRYPIAGYSALVVQAGTATSYRLRESANSFNILRIAPPRVEVEILGWSAAERCFATLEKKQYERRPGQGFVRL